MSSCKNKILIIFSLFALITCINFNIVYANDIINKSFYIGSEKSNYPVIQTNDSEINFKINRDIQNYLSDMRAAVDSIPDTSSSMYYNITYNDAKIVSLVFKEYRFYKGAAHGNYFINGVVYDKTIGERIPLSHYLTITAPQLQKMLDNKEAVILGGDGNTPVSIDSFIGDLYIPQDYCISKKDNKLYISLIYPPYALAPYVYGTLYITMPLKNN
ncbi:PdaC/SigV domain-containing protein [Pectinatus brassicae]|uniref:Deacetylase PdaC domain-containing protein n=1 Tax=Pectinatus brassicae TaxID=862415 RepID=A0A840ULB0_9FIRM|nr:DUF4163 domain-containing protein [Pectinatus brassicae]MBB5336960.1 hypothetical protein [Pectinatus brassicae]